MSEPRFAHDGCPGCKFHGPIGDEDLWTCGDTVMRRYGDDGPDYQSMSFGLIPHVMRLDKAWEPVYAYLTATPQGER